MSRKSLLKSESAAAIAIAAVLLLGLAFTIISVVKLNHAPEWKIDAERDYSYDAWSNMEDVKTRADLFTLFMGSDINYPYGLSATVPFSMGGGDVPVFEPSKSNSKLAVNTEDCTVIIAFGNHTSNPIYCGGITYYSENRQYPNQVFRYENGALILSQENNSQMKRDPLFKIKEDMKNYTVTINAINITGEPESVSSSSLTALRLTGCSVDPFLNTDIYTELEGPINSFNVSVYTHYTDAWSTYFNNMAEDAGFEYGVNYTVNSTDDCVCLSFLPTGNNYSIYVNQTVLCTGLGRRVGGGALPSGSSSNDSGNVMKLNQWYCFNTVSDTGIKLSLLSDYGTGVNLSTQNTDQALSAYYPSSNILTYDLHKSVFKATFGFSGFTEFESQPNSATILMIYRPKFDSPKYQDINVSGKSLPKLTGSTGNVWYLYKQTATNLSISDPSNLTYYMNIDKEQNGNKDIDIDYLAVRLN